MSIEGMNHFNVLTDDGGRPILHVSSAKLPADRAGVIDHMAFSATDLKGTVAKLNRLGVEHVLRQQVGTRIWQVFCHDPMGAKVELDFDPSESPP